MKKTTYLAVFEPNGNGGYGVYFPDLPGCASYGDDYEKAQGMAQEALGFHLYEMEKDGDEIPAPTKEPLNLHVYPETNEGYIISPVAIYPDILKGRLDNRAVKTNITLPAWLKEMAEEKNVNFSQLLQASLKEYLGIAQQST